MDYTNLITVICEGLGSALTAPSMSRMVSVNLTLFVDIVSNCGYAISFNENR
jgi:hypothetical protein